MAENSATLVHSLESKYLQDDDASVKEILLTSFTGFSPCKMASKRALELLVLNHMNIQTIGDSEKLANLASHVVEADLGWNQIHKWDDVVTILESSPHLRVLNIGHNPLSNQLNIVLPTVPHLTTLILNGTNLQLSTLKRFLIAFPNLNELHLSDNQFEHDENVDHISNTIKTIHLNRCNFETWESVARIIRRFPALTSLFLCENPLRTITACSFLSEELTSWKSLNLTKTQIDSWESIENLDKMPVLTELRIPYTPLMESLSEDERTHLVIGRMNKLKVLNGSQISYEQREHSERFFIRYYQDSEEKPTQYKRLVDKHGQLEKLVNIDLTPKASCSINIKVEEHNYEAQMRVNLNKKMVDFMKHLEKKVGIRYPRMKMFLQRTDGRIEDIPPMDYNFPLYRWKLEDGDTFTIQTKLIVAKSRRNQIQSA